VTVSNVRLLRRGLGAGFREARRPSLLRRLRVWIWTPLVPVPVALGIVALWCLLALWIGVIAGRAVVL
jgi:hypothetical protein